MKKLFMSLLVILASGISLAPTTAAAQQPLIIKSLAEKKVAELPPGPLYWRIENFADVAQAQAAAGPWGLVAESGGKVWLFTLGPPGGSSAGATRIADVGPISRIVATQYLLRINEASGPPGSITPAHSHPGPEAFYVLAGETTSTTPDGVKRVGAGQFETGHGADTPMRVSSTGSTDLRSLVMFVVDADRPFSSPARFP
jgi:quercetin dioxygenase-like cupin family protein